LTRSVDRVARLVIFGDGLADNAKALISLSFFDKFLLLSIVHAHGFLVFFILLHDFPDAEDTEADCKHKEYAANHDNPN